MWLLTFLLQINLLPVSRLDCVETHGVHVIYRRLSTWSLVVFSFIFLVCLSSVLYSRCGLRPFSSHVHTISVIYMLSFWTLAFLWFFVKYIRFRSYISLLFHTSISTSSSHSSLSLLLVIYVTPHIRLNILISFVSILSSFHLCYSTHPSKHPRLIRLYPCFLSFHCWPGLCSLYHFWSDYCFICSPSISKHPLHFFLFLHAVLTLCLTFISMLPLSSTTFLRYLKCVSYSNSSPGVFTLGLSVSPFHSN